MKMVDIQIDDNARYVLVATLLDQQWLEPLIDNLRSRTGLDEKLIPYDQFSVQYKYLSYKLDREEIDTYNEMNDRYETLQFSPMRGEKGEFDALEKEIIKWQNPLYNLEEKIRQALSKLRYGDDFYNVLLKAIICGEVRKGDYTGRPSRERADQIMRDRIWYWQNRRLKGKERLGFLKISKLSKVPLQTVKSAIESYQARLDSLL